MAGITGFAAETRVGITPKIRRPSTPSLPYAHALAPASEPLVFPAMPRHRRTGLLVQQGQRAVKWPEVVRLDPRTVSPSWKGRGRHEQGPSRRYKPGRIVIAASRAPSR
jgi:hypothetical protein